MQPQQIVIDRDAASRALISLIAELTWAERTHAGSGGAALVRTREEAMALLPRIETGDREAARRGMELVGNAGSHAA